MLETKLDLETIMIIRFSFLKGKKNILFLNSYSSFYFLSFHVLESFYRL